MYLLYAVRVAHAILYAFLVANHSTRSTLERNFGPNLKKTTYVVQISEERKTSDEEKNERSSQESLIKPEIHRPKRTEANSST